MKISQETLSHVVKATDEQRFEYFLHRAVPRNSYFVYVDEQAKRIEVYPFREFAEYADRPCARLKYLAFLRGYLKNEAYGDYKFVVFPIEGQGLEFSAKELYRLVLDEKKQY